jgi:hypothetical protein
MARPAPAMRRMLRRVVLGVVILGFMDKLAYENLSRR